MGSNSPPSIDHVPVLTDIAKFSPDEQPINRAILITLAYADIFDYPLSIDELHRYLIGWQAGKGQLETALKENTSLFRAVHRNGRFLSLEGRESNIATRLRREQISADLWPQAIRYGRVLAALPFVRMVAITGALAVDNVEGDADIDYLILTEPGRVWLSRAWCILLVRLAAINHLTICPNYFLSTGALDSIERSLYSAHEVAQMIPVSGLDYYQRLRKINSWVTGYLPNADGPPRKLKQVQATRTALQKAAELPQMSRLGSRVESWEMARKISKFSHLPDTESRFSKDQCKGHFDLHGEKTRRALADRLDRIESML